MHNALNTTLKVMTVLISSLSFTLAGNESNTTRTVAVKATLPTHALQGLSLKSNASTVNVEDMIQFFNAQPKECRRCNNAKNI